MYVYNKNPSKDICWSSAILKHLVATYSSSTGLSRENLVAIAGLGNAGDDLLYKDLMGEIERVRECTQLEHIEVAILTIDSESLRHPDRMSKQLHLPPPY